MRTLWSRARRGFQSPMLGTFTAITTLALVGCGGSSGNGSGEDTDLRAFVFGPDTAEEAAFLVADTIDVFLEVSEITNAVIELGESDKTSANLSGELCGGDGVAELTVPPLEDGVDALLQFSNCGEDALSGTVYFRVQSYTDAATPGPFFISLVDLDLNQEEKGLTVETRAEFAVEAFRDTQSVRFRYFGDQSESYWFLTEGGQATKIGCFDLSIRKIDDSVWLDGIRGVFVSQAKRVFSIPPFRDALLFEEGIVVGGNGFDFFSQGKCGVVGAPEGITPGTTNMKLTTDPEVTAGIVLSFPGGTINTTWSQILDDQ